MNCGGFVFLDLLLRSNRFIYQLIYQRDIIPKCSTSFRAQKEQNGPKPELLWKWFYTIVPNRGRIADMENDASLSFLKSEKVSDWTLKSKQKMIAEIISGHSKQAVFRAASQRYSIMYIIRSYHYVPKTSCKAAAWSDNRSKDKERCQFWTF